MNAEIVHETAYDGVPIRIHIIRSAGTYQPAWPLNGYEQWGDACGTVREAVKQAEERIRWDILASNRNA